MNDELNSFWGGDNWPDDAYGYEFLGRAAGRAGSFLFGNAWTGGEPKAAREPAPFPSGTLDPAWGMPSADRDSIPISQKLKAHTLLARHRPDPPRESVRLDEKLKPVVPGFSSEEWREAIKAGEDENREHLAAVQRWAKVKAFLKAQMRDGNVSFALLPTNGGAFVEGCDKIWWNVKNADARFLLCRMNPFDPYSNGFAGLNFMDIFVRKQDLDALFSLPAKQHEHAPQTATMRPASQGTYQEAVELLSVWQQSGLKQTRDSFEAYCAQKGLPSSSARDAYKTLRARRGPKTVK